MSNNNQGRRSSRDSSRIAGFRSRFPGSATLSIGNASYTPAQVIAVYQADLDAYAAVAAALAAYRTAVATAKAARAKTDAFDLLVRKFLVGSFGSPPGPVGDFGIEATPAHPPSAATKAKAVVQAKATRTARHTMGSRQKLDVTGEVPPPAATPTLTAK